jgi:PHD/YefM family antitoxin component YafN of YafNO toxin-antitoxin module
LDIRPIKDLRATSKISSLCHEKDKPIFITENGYGDLVVMSIETYEKKIAKAELYSKLAEAEQEIENGEELLDGKTVLRNLKEKYVKK